MMTIISAVALLLTLAVGLSAQAPTGAQATIPFDFNVGKANLKAGSYMITRGSGNLLKLRSSDGKTTVMVDAPLTIGARDFKAGERLVFNRYGNQYFLTQVWLTAETGRQLFPSKAEKKVASELARHKTDAQRVEVAVRGR